MAQRSNAGVRAYFSLSYLSAALVGASFFVVPITGILVIPVANLTLLASYMGWVSLPTSSLPLTFSQTTAAVATLNTLFISLSHTPKAQFEWMHRMFQSWLPLFQFNMLYDKSIDYAQQGPFVVAMTPHGVVPLAGFLIYAWLEKFHFALLGRACVSDLMFKAPVLRQLVHSVNALSATKESILQCLRSGETINLFPGGVGEAFHACAHKDELVVSHKGFVKIALETGRPIVPMYIFGHTRMYNRFPNSRILERTARYWQGTMTYFYGPLCLPVPFITRITVACGAPIPNAGPFANPTLEQVNELHEKYLQAVRELYEKHKVEAGYQDVPLDFVFENKPIKC